MPPTCKAHAGILLVRAAALLPIGGLLVAQLALRLVSLRAVEHLAVRAMLALAAFHRLALLLGEPLPGAARRAFGAHAVLSLLVLRGVLRGDCPGDTQQNQKCNELGHARGAASLVPK